MKTKILITLGILFAFFVGFIIGVIVDYPRFDVSNASGTIGKVKNYRNVKASEADIKFINDLASDTNKVKQLKAYYNFYYVNAANLSTNLAIAIKEANAVTGFGSQNQESINQMAEYVNFLSEARIDLILQITALNAISKADPALFMILRNQANNVIAQMNYRNKIVIKFLAQVDAFVKDSPSEATAGLKKIHDVLTLNQVLNSIITKDKMVLKYFDKKQLFSNAEELMAHDQTKLNNTLQQDFEKLTYFFDYDSEKLGRVFDKESLIAVFASANSLAQALLFDSEKLGILDSERLGIEDKENLGIIEIADFEKLGVQAIVWDKELGAWDSEKLGYYY
jgi:hypothetical protein